MNSNLVYWNFVSNILKNSNFNNIKWTWISFKKDILDFSDFSFSDIWKSTFLNLSLNNTIFELSNIEY